MFFMLYCTFYWLDLDQMELKRKLFIIIYELEYF